MASPTSVHSCLFHLSYLDEVYGMQLARELSNLSKPIIFENFSAFEEEINAKVL